MFTVARIRVSCVPTQPVDHETAWPMYPVGTMKYDESERLPRDEILS